ncbi:MAG: TolC family protein, partial [Pseudomonadota bacterium]
STSLNATQNLFSGMQDKAKVDQAKAGVGVSQSNLNNVKAKLSYDLKSAYMNLIFSQNSIKLTQDIIGRRESNLKLVELRFTSGRENKGSVLLSKAYLEQAKYDHLQAINSLELGQVQLAKVLGIEDNTEQIEVSDPIPTTKPTDKIDLKQLALDIPDYQLALAQEQSADAGIVLARASFFPSLNLTGSTGRTDDQWSPQNKNWSIGVGVTIPLFNGGKDYFATQAAYSNYRTAVFSKQNAFRQAIMKLKQTYNSYLEAVQKLEVDRAFTDAALTRAKVARETYNNGLLSFDDWDTIENDLINRQKALIQSERDRVIAEATWEQAQGKGVINE